MALSKTNFPNGGPNDRAILQKFYHVPDGIWGDIRYVHHGGVGTSGPGWAPENAYTTIDSAISACTANNNDLVLVLPGHAETIAAASAIDFDIAGVTVMGLGQGTNRPTVTYGTSTAASIDFSAANCTLKNIRCISNIDSLAAFIIGGAGTATIEDCYFAGASTKEVVCGILVPTTFDDWVVRRCKFVQGTDPSGTDGDTGTGAIYMEDSENVVIEDCEFRGNWETAFIHNRTTAAVNLWVFRCWGICGLSGAEPFQIVSTATGGAANCAFITPAETQVTEATLSGTFGAGFFNFQTYFGNDGGGGQLAVASQSAAM